MYIHSTYDTHNDVFLIQLITSEFFLWESYTNIYDCENLNCYFDTQGNQSPLLSVNKMILISFEYLLKINIFINLQGRQ